MNTITIELCQEDRARLDKIIEALEQSRTIAVNSMAVTPNVESDEPKSETEEPMEGQVTVEEIVETTEQIPAEEAPVEEPIKVVSLSDIQKKVVELSAAGKKAEVRDIITKYANRVSAIPAEHTAEVWDQLIGLES
jgi:hypothetical protein